MKKLFFIAFLAAVLVVPVTGTIVGAQEADTTFIGPSQDRSGVDNEADQADSEYGSNLSFYAVPPCRLLDTRNQSFFPLSAGTYYYYVANLCGVPYPAAKAVSLNTAVTQATGPGNLRHFPYGTSLPGAAFMNYGPIPGLVALSNAGIVPICDTNTSNCANGDLYTFISRSCHFIVDINGYFR